VALPPPLRPRSPKDRIGRGFSTDTAAPRCSAAQAAISMVLLAALFAASTVALTGGMPSGICGERNLVRLARSRALENVLHGGARCTTNGPPLAARLVNNSWVRSTAPGAARSKPPVARSCGGAVSRPVWRTASVSTPLPAKNSIKVPAGMSGSPCRLALPPPTGSSCSPLSVNASSGSGSVCCAWLGADRGKVWGPTVGGWSAGAALGSAVWRSQGKFLS